MTKEQKLFHLQRMVEYAANAGYVDWSDDDFEHDDALSFLDELYNDSKMLTSCPTCGGIGDKIDNWGASTCPKCSGLGRVINWGNITPNPQGAGE